MNDLQAKLAALPPYVECEQYIDGLRYDRDTVNLKAALARVEVLREWVADTGHQQSCEYASWEIGTPCTCGRDALLKATEGP